MTDQTVLWWYEKYLVDNRVLETLEERKRAMFSPTYNSIPVANGHHVVVTPPPYFGLPPVSLVLTDDQFRRFEEWLQGHGMIQDVFPDLTADQREMLLSGTDPDTFHSLCETDEDE